MRDKQKNLLLSLRSMLVGKLHTQPFTIYPDAVIEDLLDAQPKTLEELSQVKGFPKSGKRIQGFGEAVVAIFKDCDRIENFEVNTDGNEAIVGTKLRKLSVF